ncbi:MAG: hypothetical protein V5A68_02495 [Candidatus Thermoplasmatota archaeon]
MMNKTGLFSRFIVFLIFSLMFTSVMAASPGLHDNEWRTADGNVDMEDTTRRVYDNVGCSNDSGETLADNISIKVKAFPVWSQLLPFPPRPYKFRTMVVNHLDNYNNQSCKMCFNGFIENNDGRIVEWNETMTLYQSTTRWFWKVAFLANKSNIHLFGPFTVKEEVYVLDDNSSCSITFDGFVMWPVVWYTSDNVNVTVRAYWP